MPSSAAWRQTRLSLMASSSSSCSSTSRSSSKAMNEHSISSPTSVVTVPLTPLVKSRIDTTSEQGTEVTLLEEHIWQPPSRCFADEVEDDDDEDISVVTPMPFASSPSTTKKNKSQAVVISPATPFKVPFCGLGKVCWKPRGASSPAAEDTVAAVVPVQSFIVDFLGDTSTLPSWQDQFSCSVPEDQQQAMTEDEEEARIFQRALLRRRPSQMKAHRRHLDDLRRNLDPFGKSPKRNQFNRSTSHQLQSEQKPKRRTPLKELMANDKSKKTLWGAFICQHDVAANVVTNETFVSGIDGYESDPETFGRTFSARSPARVEKDPSARRLFALDVVGDDERLVEATNSVFNERWTLVLHQPDQRPRAMHVWIERGQRLSRRVVPPKLCWKNMPKKGERMLKHAPVSCLDILDIQRILPLSSVSQESREQYPLAKAVSSLLLKSVNENFCFQASSTEERDHLLSVWKLTVARFGAALVTGDDDAVEDYFAPVTAGVGGEHNF